MVYQASAPPQPKRLIKRTTGGVETNPAQTSSKQKIDQAEFNRQIIASGEAQLSQGNLKKKDVERIRLEIAQAKRELQRGTRDYSSVQNKQTTSSPAPLPTAEESAAGQSLVGGYSSVQQNASYEPLKPVPASNIYGTRTYISSKGKTAIQIPATPVQQNSILYYESKIKEPEKQTIRKDLSSQEKNGAIKSFTSKQFLQKEKIDFLASATKKRSFQKTQEEFEYVAEKVGKKTSDIFTSGTESYLRFLTRGKRGLKPESKAMISNISYLGAGVGQYLVPGYGEAKIITDIGSAVERKEYGEAAIGVVAGAGFRVAEKAGGELFGRASKYFGETYETQYGFKNVFSEKFVSKSRGKFDLFGRKSIEATKGITEKGLLIGSGVILAEPLFSSQTPKELISSSRGIGFGILGYRGATFVEKQVQPGINLLLNKRATEVFSEGEKLKEKYVGTKQEIDYKILEAPDVSRGQTNYPKATVVARDYLKEIKRKQPLSSFENRKIFENQITGFTVSGGQKPIVYRPLPGSSEIAGEYYNPINPSFTFGIEKGSGSSFGFGLSFPSSVGAPTAQLTYSKGVSLKDISRKGFDALAGEEPGRFYIPTIGKLRSKSESEVLLNTETKLIKLGTRYYTIEKNLAKQRGFGQGIFIDIPEYRVSYYQNGKQKSFRYTPKNLEEFESFSRGSLSEAYNIGSRAPIVPYYLSSRSSNKSSPTYSSSGSLVSVGRERVSYSPSSKTSYSPSRGSTASGFSFGKSSAPSYPNSSQIYYSISRGSGSGSFTKRGSGISFPPYRPPPRKNPPFEKYRAKSSFGFSGQRGFSVLTRRRGKVVNLNQNLTQSDAFAFGTNVVRNTARASFRLIPTNTYAVPKGLSASNVSLKQSKGFFVQQRGTRIGSIGEKLELRAARRNKR